MRASTLLAATAATSIAIAVIDAMARAHMCPPDDRPTLAVAWADDATGFVVIGGAAVLLAMDGDCKHRYAVPFADLHVSAARKPDGPFEPVPIEQRGNLFAWRPRAPGTWFLRVRRKVGPMRARAPATAVVLAYEPAARVRTTVIVSFQGRPRDRIALLPKIEIENDWLMPHLFLPRPAKTGTIAARLPPGQYTAREAFVDRRSRTDDGARRVDLVTTPAGQTGTLEIAGDGEARLAMHAICRMPVRPH